MNSGPAIMAGDAGQHVHVPRNSHLSLEQLQEAPNEGGAAIFLDRDGVIVEDVHFVKNPDQVRLLPGVSEALIQLCSRGSIVVVTNQSGIARGFFSERDLVDIHTEIVRQLAAEGALIDAIYYCPHLPGALVSDYDVECDCRKPAPGMLNRAAGDWGFDLSRSFMVGDSVRDIEAGLAAGIQSIYVGAREDGVPATVGVATDLRAAAQLIMQKDKSLLKSDGSFSI